VEAYGATVFYIYAKINIKNGMTWNRIQTKDQDLKTGPNW